MSNVNSTDKNTKEQVTLFRFSLIAPLVNGCYTQNSKMQYFREISSKSHTLPGGKTITISALTIKSWYLNYVKYGIDSLKPKQRTDIGNSRAISPECIERIEYLKNNCPHITGKAIFSKLIEEGLMNIKDSSISSVYRFLKSHNYQEIPTTERKAFEMEFANDCWQCDTSHGPTILVDGKKVPTFLIQIIDDASRLIVGNQFFLNDNSYNLQIVLKQAIKTYGIPKKIFVDNGTPYKSIQFQMICAGIGSTLIYAKPYSPESKR